MIRRGEPQTYVSGWKNRGQKVSTDANSLFKIASIGKLYDAVIISKLAARKQIELDKASIEYLPEYGEMIKNADKITVRMLVQHRSGIPNYTETPDYWKYPAISNEEKIAMISAMPADFEPDEKYEYSNTNYSILTLLIERVTAKSKFQSIDEEILTPLGLSNTFASISDINMDDLMSGYYVGIEEDIKYANYGSMLSTASDLSVFIRSLNEGTIFNGNEEEIYSSIYAREHTGLVPGYQSIARYVKQNDAVVIQFVNTSDFEGYNWSISELMYNRIIKILQENQKRN